jgi:hypothetical protein
MPGCRKPGGGEAGITRKSERASQSALLGQQRNPAANSGGLRFLRIQRGLMSRSVSSPLMVNRRRFIAAALALPAVCARSAYAAGDAAPMLQRAIDEAQRSGRVVMIPEGATPVSHLTISGDVQFVGSGRASRLIALGPGPMLAIGRAENVAIENVAFDGAGNSPSGEAGLVEARDVRSLADRLRVRACARLRAQARALRRAHRTFLVPRPVAIGAAQSRRHGADDCG